jgi:hypothetical protein
VMSGVMAERLLGINVRMLFVAGECRSRLQQ